MTRKMLHGHTRKHWSSPTYKSWHMMRQRCTNPNNTQYADYGGRGIGVCDTWVEFANFLADMGERPDGLTLERQNNELGYSAANCVWATRSEQQRNRRTNRMLTAGGRTQCLQAWADELGMTPHGVHERIARYGWTVERALTTPPAACGRRASKEGYA